MRGGRDEVERPDGGRLREPGGHSPALLPEGEVGAILRLARGAPAVENQDVGVGQTEALEREARIVALAGLAF